jgi:hypothetical protein
VSALATDQARKIAGTAGITTVQAMLAKAPEVTRLRYTGAAEAIVGDVLGRIACPVCTENLSSGVVVVKSAGMACDLMLPIR